MTRARELSKLANPSAFTIDSNNNVGVNSTSPDAKLDVVGVVSATEFYGDGSNLSGITAGATLSAGSGSQRVVVTSQTSGSMTAAATDAELTYNSGTNTLSASNFIGDGSGLTGIVGSGSGVIVRDSGSLVGTAGTIDFSTNLSVSAISAGIVTVTASGGATLSAGSGDQRVVVTGQTSGTMTAAGTDAELTYNSGTNTLSATQFVGGGSGLTDIVTSIVAGTNVTVSNNSGAYTINSSGGGGISGIDIQDEGSALSTSATTLNFVGGGVVASGTGVTKTITIAGGGGGGITTANISANTLQVSGVSTFSGNIVTNNANLAIVNTNQAVFTIGQQVDGTGQDHLGIYYADAGSGGADIFTSNGDMSFWVDGAGGSGSQIEFGNGFGAGGGGATWMTITSNSLSVGTGVTYSGDASYITAGKWNLGANGSTDYTFDGPGFSGATNDPILYLARGQTYEFVNGMNAHPFQIRVSNGGAAYNTGVANNGTSNGTVRFEVPMDAPNTLYYQCTSHSAMGNTINIYPTT